MASSGRSCTNHEIMRSDKYNRKIFEDSLDKYGLPSKGEEKLNNPQAQESYYTEIITRYAQYSASAIRDSNCDLTQALSTLALNPTPTLTSRSTHPTTLPILLHAMRKLRESLLATRRTDVFARTVYIFIIRAAIAASAWETYLPALAYLLDVIDPRTPLSEDERVEFAAYRVLDLACRLGDLGGAFEARARMGMRDEGVDAVLRVLVRGDWVGFWRLKGGMDGLRGKVVEFAVQRIREHALQCVGRSYLSVDREFVERCGGADWEELVKGGVTWELVDGGKVIIKKLKVK